MVVDVVVQNPQKSNVYEYEKKHVRSVGVYSGIMYGCVRYVIRVAQVDSGWGGQDRGFLVSCKLSICKYYGRGTFKLRFGLSEFINLFRSFRNSVNVQLVGRHY